MYTFHSTLRIHEEHHDFKVVRRLGTQGHLKKACRRHDLVGQWTMDEVVDWGWGGDQIIVKQYKVKGVTKKMSLAQNLKLSFLKNGMS